MAYYIAPHTPNHLVNHNVALQARLDGSPVFPSIYVIQWRQDGVPVKQGPSGNVFFQNLNVPGESAIVSPTPLQSGINFSANDAGTFIDFLILDPITLLPLLDAFLMPIGSQGIQISNGLPVISGAGVVTDAYSRTPVRPTLVWTYTDPEGDPQFQYRVRFGSTVGGAEFFDTGTQMTNAATTFSVTVPNSSPALPHGATFFWTLDVSDGQRVDPLNPFSARLLVTASGVAKVNSLPVISNVTVDGTMGGAKINDAVPTFAWTYFDVDSQPQQSFRIVVARDSMLTSVLWDSGVVVGSDSSSVYNFNLTGLPIEQHKLLYVGVYGYDTFEPSLPGMQTFSVSQVPMITTLTVDSKVNPLSVRGTAPTFNWKYIPANDPLVAYEIRVADNNGLLGTDSFTGNIWQPGVVFTPEAYSTVFNFDGSAFGACANFQTLVHGVRYYFQVQIMDGFEKSDWATGFFQLNTPPTAANVQVVPAAPFNSDDLFASYLFVDDVGDVESNMTQIRWFQKPVGGVFAEVPLLRNSKTVQNGLTIPGDEWKFTVRPHDGFEYSLVAYESAAVTILDRPPTATALAIMPSQPRTSDNLKAVFSLSDPDEDPVSAKISWFRNGIEQVAFRNAVTIPASATSIGEQWQFTVLPNDGYVNGPLATSTTVTILNTPPVITSMSVEGQVLPIAVASQNPTISWTYQDDDLQPQQKFEVLIGTRPARTTQFFSPGTRGIDPGSAALGVSLPCDGGDGIVSKALNGVEVVAGDEIFDSGIVSTGQMSYQYITADFVNTVTMPASKFQNLTGYFLEPDLQTLSLQPGVINGQAVGSFSGLPGFYDVALTFIKESTKRSTYRLIVDGVPAGQFTSPLGAGSDTHTFNSIKLNSGSTVGIAGTATDAGASAQFRQFQFNAVSRLDLNAGDFSTLSGYLLDGTGGVKLAGLAGTATTAFPFPSGTYDIEFVYQTETNGSPAVTLSVDSSVVLNFAYETGAKIRSRFLTGVQIDMGDIIKISGTRNAGAAARVKKIVFRPTQTAQVGAKLKEGLTYFASIRAFDGQDWSNWYTTKFTMAGSAWAANVSNAIGWTIEARLSVLPQ